MRAIFIGTIFVAVTAIGIPAPKVVVENGHLSPVMANLTLLDGSVRRVMLAGIGLDRYFSTHQIAVRTGESGRWIWIDSIKKIEGAQNIRRIDDEFRVVLRNGQVLEVRPAGGISGCEPDREPRSPEDSCTVLHLRNEDGGSEKLTLLKVRSVEILPPARQDRDRNAMFDHWRYSPFTGERLN